MARLLEGVRVLESAQLFSGDTAGMILGDLGADVIKVESPFRGDYIRDMIGQITPHHSPAHLQVNKNKRSVTLDLRSEEGKEAFWKLLATADVFLDGNAGDACTRLGIGYEEQRKRFPGIVYCQTSGYGAHGPYSSIPTHGQQMNALAGATPMERGPDGRLHRTYIPTVSGGTLMGGEGASLCGLWAATGIAAALVQRHRSGEGCYIDVSGADSVIGQAWLGATYALNDHRITDRATLPAGQGLPASEHEDDRQNSRYAFYETGDAKIVLFCAIEPRFWNNFCAAVGRADLVQHDDWAPTDYGLTDGLGAELEAIFRTRTLQEWVEVAVEHDIAMGPAPISLAEAREDPQLRSRQIFVDGAHPATGEFTYIGTPLLVEGQPYEVRRPAPELGENSEEILTEIGYSAADITRIRHASVGV